MASRSPQPLAEADAEARGSHTELAKKRSLKKVVEHHVKKKLDDQNYMQTQSMVFSSLFEVYKAVTASLLILFVTQDCHGDNECTIEENLAVDDNDFNQRTMYESGLAFNFATLFVFLCLYLFEIRRELLLIEYLEENTAANIDNDSVGEALRHIAPEKLAIILSVEKWYKRVGAVGIFMYICNILVSAIVISYYSAGFYTVISFTTSVLFIVKKFISIYFMITAESNVYLSAYLTKSLQYNDVDPAHKLDEPVGPAGEGEGGADNAHSEEDAANVA